MPPIDLDAIAADFAPSLAKDAAVRDVDGVFAEANHELLRAHGIPAAMVPEELGGGGASHRVMAGFLRVIARANPSTALAMAMHQHLVATSLFNDRRGKPGRKLLQAVADGQKILVSTGANDWMESNGASERVDGGYRVNAVKPFASGSPVAQMMVTSVRHADAEAGDQVLHFAVPLSAPGITLAGDWDALGMRESGSQTIMMEDVFVPDAAVTLKRPQHGYCVLFDAVVPCALPLIMSAYLGAAEAACDIALEQAKKRGGDEVTAYVVGDMLNALTVARITVADMLAIADDLAFEACVEVTDAMLARKTIAANAVIAAAEKALEAAGGSGFFRKLGLEKLLRDVHAAQFHPLPEKRQHRFSGRHALGLDPVG